MPVTSPSPDKSPGVIVATTVLVLVHVPPETESLKMALFSWHITFGPKIGEGIGYTVTVVVANTVAQLFVTV